MTPHRSRRSRRLLKLALAAGLLLLLTACAKDAPQDTLDPAGPGARKIMDLFTPVFWVAAAVFVFVEGAFLFVVLRFRRRGPEDNEVPAQVHGHTRLEVAWTIIPAVILAVLAVPTLAALFDLSEDPGPNALDVRVVGQQWWWAYEYPDFKLDGADTPVTTANELHIPAGVPVRLQLESVDVIHSFWSPRLNGKRDVVPGRIHTWTIEADEPGVYLGQCVEFCGISHSNMRLKVVAHDQNEFDQWIEDQQGLPDEPQDGAAAEGRTTFESTCATCHVVNGQFDQVQEGSPSAPNLTHLFDRSCFAGCVYELNRNELEAWLRDPQRKEGSLMVIPELSEAQIDSLVAYLETLTSERQGVS